jgi:hypothetical protein
MTEEEAKLRWCPFARGREHGTGDDPMGNVGGANRFDLGDADTGCMCIASDCMAWRGEPIMTTNDDGKIVRFTEGYCGLAGTPSVIEPL